MGSCKSARWDGSWKRYAFVYSMCVLMMMSSFFLIQKRGTKFIGSLGATFGTVFQKHRWMLNTKNVLSKINSAISKQLVLQQPASLQGTGHIQKTFTKMRNSISKGFVSSAHLFGCSSTGMGRTGSSGLARSSGHPQGCRPAAA